MSNQYSEFVDCFHWTLFRPACINEMPLVGAMVHKDGQHYRYHVGGVLHPEPISHEQLERLKTTIPKTMHQKQHLLLLVRPAAYRARIVYSPSVRINGLWRSVTNLVAHNHALRELLKCEPEYDYVYKDHKCIFLSITPAYFGLDSNSAWMLLLL